MMVRGAWLFSFAILLSGTLLAEDRLPGTGQLTLARDDEIVHAKHMAQVQDYFQRRIEAARLMRGRAWNLDFGSRKAYEQSIAPYRTRCREMLGLIDPPRAPAPARGELLAASSDLRIERITIPIVAGLSARGLLFSPLPAARRPAVIVCADAETWPEQFAGLTGDAQPPEWLTGLLGRGLAVYIPQSIERLSDHPYSKTNNDKDRRMILYRLGYPVGRTMPGLDVQDVLAAVDHLVRRSDVDATSVALLGVGQGGMTALYAAALDPRVAAAAVGDYFQVRDHCWREPNDRRLSRQLLEFGDAELAALIAPRPLSILNASDSPAPKDRVETELARAASFYKRLRAPTKLTHSLDLENDNTLHEAACFMANLFPLAQSVHKLTWPDLRVTPEQARTSRDQHFEERLKYLRRLIADSEAKRDARWALFQSSPADFPTTKAAMLEEYRKLIGHVPTGDVPLDPKTELALSTEKYKLYRITLAVTDTVDVYGNLLVPNEIQGRAAAVICQHGLSGTPEMTTGLGMTKDTAYHEFARHLAEQGYVVFSPYLMQRHWKEINVLVRQADALGMMRVAMPVAKTRRIVDFFETLPFVDPERIGYYGLSYGGYSAIWISPLEPRLAATVISGHFNDWRSKITNDTLRTSYLWHPDEDFYNWNILHRFTHPELIAMIAPRPSCIEFGERDGITTPEWTAYAWKQVRSWRDRLGLADRISLAHYDGVHEVHAVEAVDFLDHFLRPERPVGRDYETSDADAPQPFVVHVLDSQSNTHVVGRFWIPAGASRFHGMAVKLARVGTPAPLEIHFGSRPDAADLGKATLVAGSVATGEEAWYKLEIDPQPVEPGALVYYNILCTAGAAPDDHYTLYGPRPIGGRDWPSRFALSYRVLTDRALDAID